MFKKGSIFTYANDKQRKTIAGTYIQAFITVSIKFVVAIVSSRYMFNKYINNFELSWFNCGSIFALPTKSMIENTTFKGKGGINGQTGMTRRLNNIMKSYLESNDITLTARCNCGFS